MTERHVVVYCDGCGDIYSDDDGESICFDSVHQAVSYINARSARVGWRYDGDRVLCVHCVAAIWCPHGHHFPDAWQTTVWPLGTTTRSRTCKVCGIREMEIHP
ncbi:hypothetical protein AB0C34_26175 [Nocardia sp. NPDC049220]|uniref:hypothetical protein n=1 Tax=Nocardia sp. NPDC049220 TaxID=3155273 RepID=UPI0033CB871B